MTKGYARITNADSKAAEVHLFGMIGAWDITSADFVKQLKDIGRKDINLHINSPGGSVIDGMGIYDALKNHKGAVRTYVVNAVSAASFVAMAGEEVVIAPQGEMMVHDAMSFPDSALNPEECRKLLDLLERMSDKISGIYAERNGSEAKNWRKAMKRETWYNAQEAVAAGLADRIGRSNDPIDDPTDRWEYTIYNYAGRQQAPEPITPKIELPDIGAILRDAMNQAIREVVG